MIYLRQSADINAFDPIIKKGHFLLSSGRHSGTYINKDAIHLFPDLFNLILDRFSAALHCIKSQYDTIVSPAVAGISFGSPLAYREKKLFIYPEKKDNKMVFRKVLCKGLKGKRVIVVEDIVTTGGSIVKTIEAVEAAGGEVIGSIAIWLRANKVPVDARLLYVIVHNSIDSYDPEDYCPLCATNKPLTRPH